MKVVGLILLVVLALPAFAQQNNEVQLYYGFPSANLRWNFEVLGASSSDLHSSVDFGLRYRRQLDSKWGILTGLQYFQSEKIMRLMPTGMPVFGPSTFEESLKILSLPLLAEYSFLKYFYLAAGPQIDFQLTEDMFKSQNQTGIGYIVGAGARAQKEKWSFFAFPNFSRHSWIPLQKQEFDSRQVLEVLSLQIGLGYQF
jgi:hypothetical protein